MIPPRFRAPDPAARPPAWRDVLDILAAGLGAVDPAAAVAAQLRCSADALEIGPAAAPRRLPWAELDRVLLVAVGKAAGGMTAAAEAVLGERLTGGVAIQPRGAPTALARCFVHQAGHPLPDPAGLVATRQVVRILADTTPRDLVLVLISGGASAMLEQPAGRMPLVDLAVLTSRLIGSGASIDEVNAVRKHVSAVKGGRLAALAAPAAVATLVLSDVPSGRLDTIGGGPTAPDPTTYADAGAVLSQHELWARVPTSVGEHLRAGLAGAVPETPKPGDPIFARVSHHVVGDNGAAVAAAAARAAARGYAVHLPDAPLTGEARDAGRALAALGRAIAAGDGPVVAPACVVSGGETTVTLRRLGGRGGRNRELALAAAVALEGATGVTLAALATDGVDAEPSAAGAVVDGTTRGRAADAGRDADEALARHDSGPLFDALGDALVTGPTGTNVGDLAVVLVGAPPG